MNKFFIVLVLIISLLCTSFAPAAAYAEGAAVNVRDLNLRNREQVQVFFDADSVFMAILLFSLLAVLALIMRKSKLITKYSVFPLMLVLMVSIVRIFIPISPIFPKFLRIRDGILPFNTMCSKLMHFLNTPIYTPPGVTADSIKAFSILYAIYTLAAVVAVVLFVRYILKYIKGVKQFNALEKVQDEYAQQLLYEIDVKSKKKGARVYRTNCISSPCVKGILKCEIFLPNDEFTKIDLCVILKHEWQHFKRHDMLIAVLVNIVCCFMWWNPLVYPWRKTTLLSMEMQCDYNAIINANKEESLAYLKNIANTAKLNPQLNPDVAAALSGGELVERLEAMSNYRKSNRRSKIFNTVFTLLIAVLFLFSYSVQISFAGSNNTTSRETIIEIIREVEETGIKPKQVIIPSEHWLVDNGDGTYDQYLDGVYWHTLTEESALEFTNMVAGPPIVTREQHEQIMAERGYEEGSLKLADE